jgi:CRISPR-associated endonuclease Cas2
VTIAFDISDSKKYRQLIKILNKYSLRIQRSIFEAWLRRSQIGELTSAIEALMSSERYFNPDDNIRIYRIAGMCEGTVFGDYESALMDENIFL